MTDTNLCLVMHASWGIDSKVELLRRAETYPHRPAAVEVIETHMAWVFVAGPYAYKLKKPVKTPYLDFSTLLARRSDGEAEVRLNARLAPGVYLDVVPLAIAPGGGIALEGRGTAIEWLVKMRRLRADRTLEHHILHGDVREHEVRGIAERLAQFYLRTPPVPMEPPAYRRRLEDEIRANREALAEPGYHLPPELVASVTARQLETLRLEPELFEARASAGRIVEGHGDLRPEHVYFAPPVIIDCLEFNRDLRILDAAADLAFLALECDRLGAFWVADLILETYRAVAGDDPPRRLWQFYRSHSAVSRAKIAVWHLDEPQTRDRARWVNKARVYLRLGDEAPG